MPTLMTHDATTRIFPRDNDALAELHAEIAQAFRSRGLPKIGETAALVFGEAAAHAAMRELIIETSWPCDRRGELRSLFDRIGWRRFLQEEDGAIDGIELVQLWRDAVEYAGQGIAPYEPSDRPSTLEEREARVRTVIGHGPIARDCAAALIGNEYNFIWKGVAARAAIDFGGSVSLEGLGLLSDLSLAVVRNAVSVGGLHPDKAGNVLSEEALGWLTRRREFCPSRWRNLDDNQWPFDPANAITPDIKGMIWVPQAEQGDTFTPQHVLRRARSSAGISITIGAKGEEAQYSDYYEALVALAKMAVARWRRRNSVGNWGIVRARGAWVAVDKAEIDRQLAENRAEAS